MDADLREATVVTLYLSADINRRLQPKRSRMQLQQTITHATVRITSPAKPRQRPGRTDSIGNRPAYSITPEL